MFGLGVGPTPVALTWTDGVLSFAWLDQRPPKYREPASSRAEIIRAAGGHRVQAYVRDVTTRVQVGGKAVRVGEGTLDL